MLEKLVVLFLPIIVFSFTIFGQDTKNCTRLNYEDKNQLTPNPLIIKKIVGEVVLKDQEKIPLTDVCIALFDEENKKIVLTTKSKKNGNFKIKKVPNGKYRLIVKDLYGFFCVANIPLLIVNNNFERSEIIVNMISAGIDECSYGNLKKA